tara:strand:- start:73397 stop:74125 length:729 start_codon:yes stop_codon:yes gene_type:complete
MENFYLDIGNTFYKMALYKNGEWSIIADGRINHAEELKSKMEVITSRDQLIISSVRKDILVFLKSIVLAESFIVIENKDVPSHRMDYKTPDTLGVDRFLVANAAFQESGKSVIVIDAGSAITIDLMNEQGVFMGGVILPGVRIQKQTVRDHLPELPEIGSMVPADWPGKSSKECLEWGIIGGLQFTINGFINRYLSTNNNADLYVTGGDSELFKKLIHSDIEFRWRKYLLFDGMRVFAESSK